MKPKGAGNPKRFRHKPLPGGLRSLLQSGVRAHRNVQSEDRSTPLKVFGELGWGQQFQRILRSDRPQLSSYVVDCRGACEAVFRRELLITNIESFRKIAASINCRRTIETDKVIVFGAKAIELDTPTLNGKPVSYLTLVDWLLEINEDPAAHATQCAKIFAELF